MKTIPISIDDVILQSEDLIEFSDLFCKEKFKEFDDRSAIYIFTSSRPVKRLIGKSYILKIGETKNLKKRMSNYFRVKDIQEISNKPKRQTAYRLRNYLDNKETSFKLYIKYCDPEELKKEEKKLLLIYLGCHFEVPPLNMGLK